MNISLEDKTAVVCGATGGIGRATATELAQQGARIVAIARDETKVKELIDQLEKINRAGHTYIIADFSDPKSLRVALGVYLSQNEGGIDILLNNTGGPPPGPAHEADVDSYNEAFQQHLVCNQILVQQLLPRLKAAAYGRVINIISTSVKQPIPNLGVSNTIRGAVANWSKTLAGELGQFNITVNNILPGPTMTARLEGIAKNKSEKTGKSIEEVYEQMGQSTPMNRVAQPEEVANAIAFLASPAASYINGINVPVDGGRTACL